MGGWGSGPRRPGGAKRTVEGCRALRIRLLRLEGVLAPGSRAGKIQWGEGVRQTSVGFRVEIGATTGRFRVSYRYSGDRLDYTIRLAATPCRFGGVRWWFVCPLSEAGAACGRRVADLYLAGRYFGCRHCQELTYTSTRESDRRVYAALRAGFPLPGERDVRRMSVSELGFALKVIRLKQRRLDRWMNRGRS